MHYLKTKVTFAASHKLYNPEWSETKNFEVYGKCANPNGHGHNYTVEVTLSGKADTESGMLMNFRDVKKILRSEIYDLVDHRNLNIDIPQLKNVIPTAENLAQFFWRLLSPHFEENVQLREVTVQESDKNIITYTEI